MRRLIAATYPDHGIVGEEYGPRARRRRVRLGARPDRRHPLLHHRPAGLGHADRPPRRTGEPVLGMMAQPFTGERFAGDGKRAWYAGPGRRRRRSRTRPCAALAEAALFTTTPATCSRTPTARPIDRVESCRPPRPLRLRLLRLLHGRRRPRRHRHRGRAAALRHRRADPDHRRRRRPASPTGRAARPRRRPGRARSAIRASTTSCSNAACSAKRPVRCGVRPLRPGTKASKAAQNCSRSCRAPSGSRGARRG